MTDAPRRVGVGTKPELIWGGYRAPQRPGQCIIGHSRPTSGAPSTAQISFRPLKLAWPWRPTMMWSWMAMPSGLAALDDLARHVDIGARGRGVARGVVVDQDDGAGGQLQRALHHLADVDRRVVDRAAAAAPRRRSAGSSCRGTGCGTARAPRSPWRRGSSRARRSRMPSTGRCMMPPCIRRRRRRARA